MNLTRNTARSASPCSWCGASQPDDQAGWTVADLAETFVARYTTVMPLGGGTENCVTAHAGPRTACPACTADLAAGRYAAIAARSDGGPSTTLYLQAVARRLGPAGPVTKENTR